MPPRTIDNLGVESYTRYAEDQALFDKTFLTEPRKVLPPALIDVTLPSFRSQFRLLLGISLLHPSWATFAPPEEFAATKRELFTTQLLPMMGSADKKSALMERIKKRPKEQLEREKGEKRPLWEEEREKRDEEQEQKSLLELFSCLEFLNKDMIEILTKTKQYHKG
ncbi:MAG: hypothetical protein A2Y28_01060 [Chlamydiae bacterium GWC2_50_10]|nr:MAG: hypothetical protein A2Z85_03325 [Chlamydiae bacterium GWA2_50_15]OGN53760.1 MAG: hypothetical protein A2Y28_01060 [Chlamydiae bacterium GWC2_50_10]OGN54823.1 MAG: hypothetical protein A2098_03845 [Chlamydiae bacterium GWF2_49_8]OGN58609.1 MAG: hypothetical protein A3D18_04585 [Chlamydiae bacterium RIFCSPHIGHO2_02_FULL_49_29]OGN63817.1 MAG: hypothetical protein A3E26_00945 [Chlamydiae bacterium RIFCSPHIGHO2_12_FULL_49_32]OGN70250.1 MAG: hypothetical protein A3I15_02420 [Chlamydiae bact